MKEYAVVACAKLTELMGIVLNSSYINNVNILYEYEKCLLEVTVINDSLNTGAREERQGGDGARPSNIPR